MALIDVVEWKNKQGEIMFRFPEGAVSLAAQLIVMENQEAVFFREGRIYNSYGPGRYTLKSLNIPILEKIVNLPFGGKTPFPAEIYYINKTEIPNLKWGTKQPIELLDPIYNIAIPIRAFGNFSIKIQDTKSFLTKAIGTWQAYTSEAVESTLRDQIIIPKLSDFISELMLKKEITILKLAPFYNEIGLCGKEKILDDFSSYGLELVRFAVESINVSSEDESVKRLKKALADKAEIGIMGQNDYKMKRTFDTMEKAAGSEGMSGGMMGAGMGVGMGQQMAGMMGQAMSSATTQVKIDTISCAHCKAKIPQNSKFCPECGTIVSILTCIQCGTQLNIGAKFCQMCGFKQD